MLNRVVFFLAALFLMSAASKAQIPDDPNGSQSDKLEKPLELKVNSNSNALRWGKLSPECLSMTSYPADPKASVIILDDLGLVRVTLADGLKYRIRHKRRFKVFSPDNLDPGLASVSYRGGDDSERILTFKAQIINTKGKKRTISKKSIQDRKIDSLWNERIIDLADLDVGDIVEYNYEMVSDRIGEFRDWYFQTSAPIRHSELVFEIPEAIDYAYIPQQIKGWHHMSVEKISSHLEGTEPEALIEADKSIDINRLHFHLTEIPAYQKPVLVWNENEHKSRVRFLLNKFIHDDGLEEILTPSWTEFSNSVEEQLEYALYQLEKSPMQLVSIQSRDQFETDEEHVNAILQALRKHLLWDDTYNLSLPEYNDTKTNLVSAAQFNLHLLYHLRKSGYECSPLLLSTKQNGAILHQFPLLKQFNHLVIRAKLDGNQTFLDGVAYHQPLGYISEEAAVDHGWLIDGPASRWVDLPWGKGGFVLNTKGKMGMDGKFIGTALVRLSGYNINEWINPQGVIASDELLSHLKKRMSASFEVEEIQYKVVPSLSNELGITAEIQLTGQLGQMKDGKLYYYPVIGSNFTVPPLLEQKRDYPVELRFPEKEQILISVTLPKKFEDRTVPKDAEIRIYDNGGYYRYQTKIEGNNLQVLSHMRITKIKYEGPEYDDIKEFFEEMSGLLDKEVILEQKVN